MPRVAFTPHLERHVACPAEDVNASSVAEALSEYFARHPKVRSYVLDEQSALRKHVVIFVDGVQVKDRTSLGELVTQGSEIWVMQALSGG